MKTWLGRGQTWRPNARIGSAWSGFLEWVRTGQQNRSERKFSSTSDLICRIPWRTANRRFREIEITQHIFPNSVKPSVALLIVDDDEFLLRYVRLVLVRAGYGVLAAQNGEEAWRLILDKPHQIRLLLTDIVMPGSFDGFELAERTQKLHPDLPVLLMTGALPNDSPRTELFAQQGMLLRKPFYPDQLLTIVRENLESAERSMQR